MIAKISLKTMVVITCVLVVIALVTTYIVTSTLNPLEVYRRGSVVGIIIVSLATLYLVALLFALLQTSMLRRMIRASTGQDPDDVRCPACGNPLLAFMGSHGYPVQCPSCGKLWHNGPACYSKGLPKIVKIALGTVCPECRGSQPDPEAELLRDLRDDLERSSK